MEDQWRIVCSEASRVAACRLWARMCLAVYDRHNGEQQFENNGSAWAIQLFRSAEACLLPKPLTSPTKALPRFAFACRRLFVMIAQYCKEELLNLCELPFALPVPSEGCKRSRQRRSLDERPRYIAKLNKKRRTSAAPPSSARPLLVNTPPSVDRILVACRYIAARNAEVASFFVGRIPRATPGKAWPSVLETPCRSCKAPVDAVIALD